MAYGDGDDVPPAPELVQADDGTPEVWIIDGKTRRHVMGPASFAAWRFDAATIKKPPAATVYANALGQDWPREPFLVQAGPAIYVLDGVIDPASTDVPVGGSPGNGSGASAAPGADAEGSESSGCTASPRRTEDGYAWTLLAGVLVLARRTRSRAKPRVRNSGS